MTLPEATTLQDRVLGLLRLRQSPGIRRNPEKLMLAVAAEVDASLDFEFVVLAECRAGFENILVTKGAQQYASSFPRPAQADSDSPARWAMERGEAVIIGSLTGETRFREWLSLFKREAIQSACAFPLTGGNGTIGALLFASRNPHAYGAGEVSFISQIAAHIAESLGGTLEFEASASAQAELTKTNERLKFLLELNNTLVSNLEFQDLLRAISTNIRAAMRCDGAGVMLSEPGAERLRLYAVDFPGVPGVEEGVLIPDDSPVTTAFHSGEPVAVVFAPGSKSDEFAQRNSIQAACHIPLIRCGRKLGVLALARRNPRPFTPDDLAFLGPVASQVAIAVENALAFREIAELKNRLANQNLYLENEIRSERNFEEIVGTSQALRQVLQQVEIVAPTDSTVLIYGETGTGKELIARAIHDLSSRSKSAFVKLNCGAIPTGLLESELFGHERGAFTGAVAQRIGRFELADRGTVFLDEIAEIALELQPKLLRVLQEREFERLGNSRTLHTDARLIAATNRDLAAMVADQKFRADLFYRLNVFPLHVPPLRERAEDIPLLVRHFVRHFARRMNRALDTISSEAMSALVSYHWPGNIRELQNVIERAVILSRGPVLQVPVGDLKTQPAGKIEAPGKIATLEEVERRHILETLDAARWVIAGEHGAAALLGLKRSTLQARMEKLGIRRARTAG